MAQVRWIGVRHFWQGLPEHLFVDAGKNVSFRLEQIYTPSLELAEPLAVRVTLNKPGTGQNAAQTVEKLKDAGAFAGVSRDLIDNPFRFDLDLSGIPDGRTIVRTEVLEGNKSLGTATLTMEVRRGLDERLRRIESEASQVRGFDSLRAGSFIPSTTFGM